MTQITNPSTDFLERIRRMRSEKRQSVSSMMKAVRAGYFGTETDFELDTAMDDMFDDVIETLDAEADPSLALNHVGRIAEGYPLLGLGASGTRKTSTFNRMIRLRKEFEGFDYAPHLNSSPLISVKAPSPCTLRVLGVTVARAMGLACNDTMAENVIWDLIIENLPARGLRFIHIDEFQHVMENRNVVDIAKIRNAMKRLVQTPGHPVWLLITGMPEIAMAFEGDTQLWRRKIYVLFHDMIFERDVGLCREMVKFFATDKAELTCKAFDDDDTVHRLMHASLNRLGIAIDIVVKAIRAALKAGSSALESVHFAKSYKVFTGCPDSMNPFLVSGDYTAIEVDKYVTRLIEDEKTKGTAKAKGAKQ